MKKYLFMLLAFIPLFIEAQTVEITCQLGYSVRMGKPTFTIPSPGLSLPVTDNFGVFASAHPVVALTSDRKAPMQMLFNAGIEIAGLIRVFGSYGYHDLSREAQGWYHEDTGRYPDDLVGWKPGAGLIVGRKWHFTLQRQGRETNISFGKRITL